jgi:hypothetical protein
MTSVLGWIALGVGCWIAVGTVIGLLVGRIMYEGGDTPRRVVTSG